MDVLYDSHTIYGGNYKANLKPDCFSLLNVEKLSAGAERNIHLLHYKLLIYGGTRSDQAHKKLFGIWETKNPIWHKLGEFLLEIFIIIFAITISIYFHDRSVLKHQRHETKEFLAGLRQDLTTDIEEMNQDKSSFVQSEKVFYYITGRKLDEPLNADTIRKYYGYIFNTTGLIPNSGRFEGFKSAGKIGTIENKELQNNIMDLYQENIPNLINSTNFYTAKKQRLFEYIYINRKRLTDSTSNLVSVLATDPAYNISVSLTFVKEILSRYDTCINKMNTIISDINKQYGH